MYRAKCICLGVNNPQSEEPNQPQNLNVRDSVLLYLWLSYQGLLKNIAYVGSMGIGQWSMVLHHCRSYTFRKWVPRRRFSANCLLLPFTLSCIVFNQVLFSLKDKMHFGRLCKLRVRQWTVNPSPPLTTVWSPYSLWWSPYWFITGNSMSIIECCHYKCVSEYTLNTQYIRIEPHVLRKRQIVVDVASN